MKAAKLQWKSTEKSENCSLYLLKFDEAVDNSVKAKPKKRAEKKAREDVR